MTSVLSWYVQKFVVCYKFCLGLISLMIFPSQFKFDENLIFVLIQILTKQLQQNFAHDMTSVLSWYVQKFVAIS